MSHHVESFDGIRRDHFGEGGYSAWERIVEGAHATSFVYGDAPSMGVDVCVAASAFEAPAMKGDDKACRQNKLARQIVHTKNRRSHAPKREVEIRRSGAIHPKKPA
jgi:hypothetical protein